MMIGWPLIAAPPEWVTMTSGGSCSIVSNTAGVRTVSPAQ
jgi:hypothetical protein